jgi:hypothetical protein
MSGKGGKPRNNPGVAGPNPHLKEMRKREAAERQEEYNKKSVMEIIAELDTKFGVGKGATKQRAKLARKQILTVPAKSTKRTK